MRNVLITVLFLSFSFISFSQTEQVDADMIAKIRNEGLKNSKVMDIAFHLTDASGPRLTNSPGFYRAANWAIAEMKKWGLENSRLEAWGNFGKGWELERSYLAMTAPYYKPIISFPKTWTSGTQGMKTAEVIVVKARDSASLDVYRGKLKNKIIIINRTDSIRQTFRADANRFTDEQLTTMANFKPAPRDTTRRNPPGGNRGGPRTPVAILRDMAKAENAVAILSAAPNGRDGTLFVQGGGPYAMDAQPNFLDMVIAYEDFMMIQRLANSGIPVKLETDVKSKFIDKDATAHNVFAEIRGTDPKLKDEVVMLGGHLDSWQGSTGATDNAAGCAVMMEAVRILKALGVQPRRTIRIALWSGEEQGLLGSRNYVRNNLTDTVARTANAAGQKVSVYFNLDNGTGKIRGIYLQGNENARPIFTEWMKSFYDIGATTVTLQNTGGTDHLAFDAVGIPGFQFIQDQIEYNTRTHHTNMDSYDHLIAADLQQAATVIAAFVYNAAMRDEKIPRKN